MTQIRAIRPEPQKRYGWPIRIKHKKSNHLHAQGPDRQRTQNAGWLQMEREFYQKFAPTYASETYRDNARHTLALIAAFSNAYVNRIHAWQVLCELRD